MNIWCAIFGHKAGRWQAAVGGRDVQRCKWCDAIVEEKIAGIVLPPIPKPRGRPSDRWGVK
jgi:hypothetical protein